MTTPLQERLFALQDKQYAAFQAKLTAYSNLHQIFQIHLYQKKNGERDYASCLQSITKKTSQQLINECTTRDIHVHISCYAIAQQLLDDQRSYIFQLLLLYFHPNIRYCRKNCLPLSLCTIITK